MKTEIEMARDGEFLRKYGTQHFIVVSEALSIGRVKWEMVPKGKNGKGGLTFYMTTEQVLGICKEINNGTFAKKIAADTGAYPGAYKYATGDDASLHLNIGGGKVGCRIQMQDSKKKLNYTMALSMDDMTRMAQKYMLNTGMIAVAQNSYYASVIAAFEEGRNKRAKFRKPDAQELGEPVDLNNSVVAEDDAAAEAPATTAAPAPTSEPAITSVSPDKDDKKSEPVIANFKIVAKGTRNTQRGFYTFPGKIDGTNESVTLMFRIEDANKIGWFAKFENSAAVEETTISIAGEKRGSFIMYTGPAKK
jgi:hypothetical protein